MFEELNENNLKSNLPSRKGKCIDKLWLKVIGKERKLAHKFIDPGIRERVCIGISKKNAKEPEMIALREKYWLDRMDKTKFMNALCVIGASHIDSFRNRLLQKYECTVEKRRFNPAGLKVECEPY